MWMAGHWEELQERLQSRVRDLRTQGYGRTVHARLPSALAELQAGWEIFLRFAFEIGAIDRAEEKELEQRGGRALEELGVLQAKYQEASDPALLADITEEEFRVLELIETERQEQIRSGDSGAQSSR
jgi:hypothetical protein